MYEIVLSTVFSFLIVLLLTPVVREIATIIGAVANQNHRTIHKGSIAKLGGIAIYLGFVGGVALIFALKGIESEGTRMVLGLLVGATLMLILGIADDVRELSCYEKIAIQIFGALLAIFFGFQVQSIAIPFLGSFELGVLAIPLSVLWIVGLVNAMNLIDGLDGLAVGIASLVMLTTLISGVHGQNILIVALSGVLLGSLLGFMPHNYHSARIFLGDSGSLMLGFLLACLSLQGSRTPDGSVVILVPVLALALPIIDTLLAIIRRIRHHVHPFQADKEHIHHRLLYRLKDHKTAVHALWIIALICQMLALCYYFLGHILPHLLLGVTLLALYITLRRVDFLKYTPRQNM